MNKEIIANLAELDEIELIYESRKLKNNKLYLNYTVICDINNIVSDDNLMLCKRIIATMSVMQELFAKHNIIFSYTIKTSDEFENSILNKNNNELDKKLKNIEILYSKNNYFQDLIEENKAYTKSKRA